jgi:hypothetical protein
VLWQKAIGKEGERLWAYTCLLHIEVVYTYPIPSELYQITTPPLSMSLAEG